MALLTLDKLSLTIGRHRILDGIDLDLHAGKVTGLVGESGSGKSMTALSIMRLLPHRAALSGAIRFAGRDLAQAGEKEMCALRGDDIGMVFQEPMTALNPLMTIGEQVAEGIRLHTGASRAEADERAATILEHVGLPGNRFPLSRYPHELSGGQRQRVGIAMACALKPKLLIADEPTTALDVVVQARILDLLRDLVVESGMALLFISHDLGVVAGLADDIAIMRHGAIVEKGPAVEVLKERKHPYTARLAEASSHVPPHRTARHEEARRPLIEVRDLVCEYPTRRTSLFQRPQPFRAVDGVSFDLGQGEILGLVGESGCGKSTLSRCLLGLMPAAAGSLTFEGKTVGGPADPVRQHMREATQAVFQDPYASFNPRHRAGRLVTEPLFQRAMSSAEKRDLAAEALVSVGMTEADLDKYPHEFSGGQRQRLAIARAIVGKPRIVIADEPVSALDVSIRAQVLDLIVELRERLDLAWLFVSHDLSVVHALCDRVLVMRHGRIVEAGPVADVYADPREAYTRQLIAAAPDLARALETRSRERPAR